MSKKTNPRILPWKTSETMRLKPKKPWFLARMMILTISWIQKSSQPKLQKSPRQLVASSNRIDSNPVEAVTPDPVVNENANVKIEQHTASLHKHPSSRPTDSAVQNERNVSAAVGSPAQAIPKQSDALVNDAPSGKHFPAWERPVGTAEDPKHHSNDLRSSFGLGMASQREADTEPATVSHQHPLPDPTFECEECKQLKIKIRQTEEGIQALKSALAARETTIMELRTKKQELRARSRLQY
mmetsp:Transcript_10575/g.18160  ORF Transcript_10575/g.18160 Transcript_10575/m.18160 type:complete len:241 (+) Transcript_10575:387-1109(+)